MKLQVDIPEDINIQLKIYKIKHKFVTMGDVVNKLLAEKFGIKLEKKENDNNLKKLMRKDK